jgi:hypothetical protein
MSFATNVREGYVAQLEALIDGLTAYLHLYTNDPTISEASVKADFAESAFEGYAPVALSKWSPPALRAGLARSQADTAAFTWTGGATPPPVRGYFVTEGPNGVLLAAWRKPGDAFPIGPGHLLLLVNVELIFPPP